VKLPDWMYRDRISPLLHTAVVVLPALILATAGWLLGSRLLLALALVWLNGAWGFYVNRELGPGGDLEKAKGVKAKVKDSGADIGVPSLFATAANFAIWSMIP